MDDARCQVYEFKEKDNDIIIAVVSLIRNSTTFYYCNVDQTSVARWMCSTIKEYILLFYLVRTSPRKWQNADFTSTIRVAVSNEVFVQRADFIKSCLLFAIP